MFSLINHSIYLNVMNEIYIFNLAKMYMEYVKLILVTN